METGANQPLSMCVPVSVCVNGGHVMGRERHQQGCKVRAQVFQGHVLHPAGFSQQFCSHPLSSTKNSLIHKCWGSVKLRHSQSHGSLDFTHWEPLSHQQDSTLDKPQVVETTREKIQIRLSCLETVNHTHALTQSSKDRSSDENYSIWSDDTLI